MTNDNPCELGHAYSFVNPNGYDFEWNGNFFDVKEKCSECGKERMATYCFESERDVDNEV